jgi:hypothetical protein
LTTAATEDISVTLKTTSQVSQPLLSQSVTGDLIVEQSETLTETLDKTKTPKMIQTSIDKETSVRVPKSIGVSKQYQPSN